MESLLTYVLQVNILLSLIYLGYYFLLKGLTFYQLNRVYFIIGSIYAFLYPFLDIKSWFMKQAEIHYLPEFVGMIDLMPMTVPSSKLTLLDMLIAVVGIGAAVFLIKFAVQLISLGRIHFHSNPAKWNTYFFRNVVFPIVPFSFFNKVYVHQQQHQEVELQDIFEHEYIHVKGRHTSDILLFEMILIGCWYNPFVWLMRRAVRQNLEFLTDQQVLNKGVDRQTYQYSLLNVTKQGTALGIGNQFNFKTLKKRIMMMNKKRSSKLELSKYAFLLPIVLLAGASFTVSKAQSKIETVVEKAKDTEVLNSTIAVKMKGEVGELLKETFGTDVIEIDTSRNDTLVIPASSKGTRFFMDDGSLPKHDSMFVYNQINFLAKDAPYILVDGKEIKSENLKSLSPDDIESISILKKDQGKSVYGDKGKNGVIIISSKANAHVKPLVQGKVVGVRLTGDSLKNTFPKNVLYIIDGKESTVETMESLDANDIESITVLKDKQAVDKYGDRAKDGVIVVVTKSYKKVLDALKETKSDGVAFQQPNGEYRYFMKASSPRVDDTIKDALKKEIQNRRKNEEVKVVGYKKGENSSVDNVGYVLDGKLVDQNTIKSLNPKDIESIKLNMGNQLTEKYNKSSILNVQTKQFAGTLGTPSQFTSISFDEKGQLALGGGKLEFAGNGTNLSSIEASQIFIKHDSTKSGR